MKIDDPRTPTDTTVTPTSADPVRPGTDPRARVGGDGVTLSHDLRLAHEAIAAANVSSNVRSDVVERARALLESGSLGADLDRLAGRMIDALIESNDDGT
jgi:hypothetical protein